jgi:cyclopropane fatty-acyl-phospholipid synthase-like methyltransferase
MAAGGYAMSQSKDLPDGLDLVAERFPRSASYDLSWVMANQMGPNVLWLTEYLIGAIDLRPGMRVLDMGCGRAISSIFLARERDVQVWATDLWIAATDNLRRIAEAGLEGQVFPIHAEAHALPFAHEFFDAAVSMDAYHYFGTDDLYLGYFSRFLKPGAALGIVVPGVTTEIGADIPEHLLPHWHWDFCSFHGPEWWRTHWEKTGLVDVVSANLMPDGARLWTIWEETMQRETGPEKPSDLDLLRADAGRSLGFTRVVARRRASPRYMM